MKSEVQADLDALKSALASDDQEAIQKAADTLAQSQSKLGEALYQQQGEADAAAAEGTEDNGEDIVDAEVVDDESDDKK